MDMLIIKNPIGMVEDKVTFFSKEKQLTDGVGGYAPQISVWPNISFK